MIIYIAAVGTNTIDIYSKSPLTSQSECLIHQKRDGMDAWGKGNECVEEKWGREKKKNKKDIQIASSGNRTTVSFPVKKWVSLTVNQMQKIKFEKRGVLPLHQEGHYKLNTKLLMFFQRARPLLFRGKRY